jgi:hypothetical protein
MIDDPILDLLLALACMAVAIFIVGRLQMTLKASKILRERWIEAVALGRELQASAKYNAVQQHSDSGGEWRDW